MVPDHDLGDPVHLLLQLRAQELDARVRDRGNGCEQVAQRLQQAADGAANGRGRELRIRLLRKFAQAW
jgi:hypothetical protein